MKIIQHYRVSARSGPRGARGLWVLRPAPQPSRPRRRAKDGSGLTQPHDGFLARVHRAALQQDSVKHL